MRSASITKDLIYSLFPRIKNKFLRKLIKKFVISHTYDNKYFENMIASVQDTMGILDNYKKIIYKDAIITTKLRLSNVLYFSDTLYDIKFDIDQVKWTCNVVCNDKDGNNYFGSFSLMEPIEPQIIDMKWKKVIPDRLYKLFDIVFEYYFNN